MENLEKSIMISELEPEDQERTDECPLCGARFPNDLEFQELHMFRTHPRAFKGIRHLCKTCTKTIVTCNGIPEFGTGIGHANVINCSAYRKDDHHPETEPDFDENS